MDDVSEVIRKAKEVEERNHALIMAVLNDEEFMKGVLDSQERAAAGEQGEPWDQVKARLGIV